MIKQTFVILAVCSLLTVGITQYGYAESVPPWVKNTAKWYGDGQISEKEFLNAIKYLINNGILNLDDSAKVQEQTMVVVPTPNISELDSLEIPVTDNDTKEELLSSDLDLIKFKVVQLMELAEDPIIRQAVIDSNQKFSIMDDKDAYITAKDKEWKSTPKNQESAFMGSLIENNVSKILKQKQKIVTEEFGEVLFPEIIITNKFGANVAITGRTDDYNQGDEFWWIRATSDPSVQFRDVMWDESAKIFSADIVIQIQDKHGNFIGVLNAATPVR